MLGRNLVPLIEPKEPMKFLNGKEGNKQERRVKRGKGQLRKEDESQRKKKRK